MNDPSEEMKKSIPSKILGFNLFFTRKSLVLLAILLTASSALITYFLVNTPNTRLMHLKNQESVLDSKIRDFWFDATQINRDADMAVLILLLDDQKQIAPEILKKHFFARLDLENTAKIGIPEILKKAEETRHAKIDGINSTYIEHLALEKQIGEAEGKITFFSNIAFFLQIFGLILIILTRDMPL
jgi:hypothetical protein